MVRWEARAPRPHRLLACGAAPERPAFEGRETDSWIACDVVVPDANQRSHGAPRVI